METGEILKYKKYYNKEKLSEKIFSVIGKISSKALYYLLLLTLLISDKNIPKKVRLVFIAALGYFILPTDIIADILPGLGFTDDVAFLAYAINNAAQYITPEMETKAKEKLNLLLKKRKESD